MPNPQNLKNFEKGDSRINRKGRPKKLPALDELLAEVLGEEKGGKTYAQIILNAMRAKAAKGDTKAADILLDRCYGKAKQAIDLDIKGSIEVDFTKA